MGEPMTPEQEAERDMDDIFERHGPELQAAIRSALALNPRATMVPLTPEMARAQADLHAESNARIAKLEGLLRECVNRFERQREAGLVIRPETENFLARIKQELGKCSQL